MYMCAWEAIKLIYELTDFQGGKTQNIFNFKIFSILQMKIVGQKRWDEINLEWMGLVEPEYIGLTP